MTINYILNRLKTDIANVKKNDQKKILPNEIKKEIINKLDFISNTQGLLSKIKNNMFLADTHFEDGTIKKSVRNAFEEDKYKQILCDYLSKKKKSKNDSTLDTINFHAYENLKEDLYKLEDIFDNLDVGLNVIKNDIEQENFVSVEVACDVSMLIARLGQLYNLYGHYLEDIEQLEEYTVFRMVFQALTAEFEDLFVKLK